MIVSIGGMASRSQGISHYERDRYCAIGDLLERKPGAWAGRGAAELGLKGSIDPHMFVSVLAGHLSDGLWFGKRGRDEKIAHCRSRASTFSGLRSPHRWWH